MCRGEDGFWVAERPSLPGCISQGVSKEEAFSGRTCIAALQDLRFAIKRQQASHIILRREDPFAQVVVPDHRVLDRGIPSWLLFFVGQHSRRQ